jgi:acetyl esterase/lipase
MVGDPAGRLLAGAAVRRAVACLAAATLAIGGPACGASTDGAARDPRVATGRTEASTPDCNEMPCPGDVPLDAPHCSFETSAQIAYEVPGMDDVRVECGIPYGQVGGVPATLDLYLPPDAHEGDSRPAIVFVHGNELPDPLHPLLSHWKRWEYTRGLIAAALGYVGVAFDYRGYDDAASLADAEDDVLSLLAYVGQHADELLIDTDRICLWATSGGGFPAAWAALLGEPRPRCLVAFSAGLDAPWASDRDPAALPPDDAPPLFVARGALDDYARGDRLVDRAREAGVEVIVEEHPTGGHGFENERDRRQQRIVVDALAFVAAHLEAT